MGGRAGEGGSWFDDSGGALKAVYLHALQIHAFSFAFIFLSLPLYLYIPGQQTKTFTRPIEWAGIFVEGQKYAWTKLVFAVQA